jgi:hypothetical protein
MFIIECDSQCSEQEIPAEAAPVTAPPQPHVLNVIGSLVPVSKSSPERRNQKEIVAGEERPKFLATTKTEDSQGMWRASAAITTTTLLIFPLFSLRVCSYLNVMSLMNTPRA